MNKVYYIGKDEYERLVEDKRPTGLFITKELEGYIGIDNTLGECFVEEFTNKEECIKWLKENSLCAI